LPEIKHTANTEERTDKDSLFRHRTPVLKANRTLFNTNQKLMQGDTPDKGFQDAEADFSPDIANERNS
jgi:hypothetical protein